MPQIVLQQEGYTETEWDTVVTRVYEPGFKEPVITDTFVAKKPDDVILITPEQNNLKDFEVHIPAVNATHRLYDIDIEVATAEVSGENSTALCYHSISYLLDGEQHSFTNAETAISVIKK